MDAGCEIGNFAETLRRFRRRTGLTQEALADRATISVDAISALERGTRRSPRKITAELLADGLELESTKRAQFLAAASRAAHASQERELNEASCQCKKVPAVIEPMIHSSNDLVEGLASAIIAFCRLATPTELSMAAIEALGRLHQEMIDNRYQMATDTPQTKRGALELALNTLTVNFQARQ